MNYYSEEIEKRIKYFKGIHHNYEAKELQSALDTIKRLVPPAPAMVVEDGWIDVKDRLPDKGERVIVCTYTGYISVGYILNGIWERNDDSASFESRGHNIIYWMPLPNPPKQ